MAAFDILAYVEENLDRAKPSAGDEWTAVCPDPDCGRWGGFYVNTDSGAYVCFKCGIRSKSVVGLVALVEGLSWSEARAYIFKRSVKLGRKDTLFSLRDRILALRPHELGKEAVETEPLDFPLPDGMTRCYHKGVWSLPRYLKTRRIRSATARAWGLGWCRWGDMANRLIIPIRCPAGRSWTGRAMLPDMEPRYWNPPGADHRRVLIGWEQARLTGDMVICEGPLDALKLWQHGISALALGGKELHDEQLAMLVDLPSDTVFYVMLDPEELEAPVKVATRLSCHFDSIFIARLPEGVDPGASTPEDANKALEDAERFTGARKFTLEAKLRISADSIASRH